MLRPLAAELRVWEHFKSPLLENEEEIQKTETAKSLRILAGIFFV